MSPFRSGIIYMYNTAYIR